MEFNLKDKNYEKEALRTGYISLLIAGNKETKDRITANDICNIINYNFMFEKEYEEANKIINRKAD